MNRKPLKATCPGCRSGNRQVRNGKNKSGTAKAKCQHCGKTYTLLPTSTGYGRNVVARIIHAYLRARKRTKFALNDNPGSFMLNPTEERLSRKIARRYGINHQTLLNWLHNWPEYEGLADYVMSFPIRSAIDKRILLK